MVRETHAASDRKQNRTAGCKAAGSSKNDLQAKPTRQADTWCFAQGAGASTQKRGFDSPVRTQTRGNEAKTARSEKHGPAAIECHVRSLTGG